MADDNKDTKENGVIVNESQDDKKQTQVNQLAGDAATTINQSSSEKSPTAEDPEKSDEEEKVASLAKKPDPAKYKPEEKENGPFASGDIIKYMFEKWLIAFMNYAWERTFYHMEVGYYNRKYKRDCRKAAKKKFKKLKEHETYKKSFDLQKTAADNISKSEQKFNDNKDFIKLASQLRSGNFDGVSEETAFLLKNLPKKTFDSMLEPKRIEEMQKRINNNMIAASQFANTYAEASLLDAKMKKASSPTDKSAFERAQKEGYITYMRLINEAGKKGMDVSDVSKRLLSAVNNATRIAHKNIEKGNFDGYSKKGLFGRTIKGQYKGNPAFDQITALQQVLDLSSSPKSIVEEMVMQQNIDKRNADKWLQYDTAVNLTQEQRNRLKKRREQFLAAKERINNDPQKKSAREKIEAMRARKRAQKIEALKDPNYVMKDKNGNDNPALTAAMRKYYQDRFMMK